MKEIEQETAPVCANHYNYLTEENKTSTIQAKCEISYMSITPKFYSLYPELNKLMDPPPTYKMDFGDIIYPGVIQAVCTFIKTKHFREFDGVHDLLDNIETDPENISYLNNCNLSIYYYQDKKSSVNALNAKQKGFLKTIEQEWYNIRGTHYNKEEFYLELIKIAHKLKMPDLSKLADIAFMSSDT